MWLFVTTNQIAAREQQFDNSYKVGRVFPMVVSLLPHAEFGPNDHRENAPRFKFVTICVNIPGVFCRKINFEGKPNDE